MADHILLVQSLVEEKNLEEVTAAGATLLFAKKEAAKLGLPLARVLTGVTPDARHRPVATIQNGHVTNIRGEGPFLDILQSFENLLVRAADAVGCVEIQPSHSEPKRMATAFLISPDYALTARHVAQQIAPGLLDGETTAPVIQNCWLNLDGENLANDASAPEIGARRRIEIRRVAFAGRKFIEDRKFDPTSTLDLAVLELGSPEHNFPRPASLRLEFNELTSHDRIAAIGFPALPQSEEYEFPDIVYLFQRKFGFKRVSMGETVRALPGEDPKDLNRWFFRHDAPVVGGSSGSPIIRLRSDDLNPVAIGIHFYGVTPLPNFSHSFAQTEANLRGYINPTIT